MFKLLRGEDETGAAYMDRLHAYVVDGIDEPRYSADTLRSRVGEALQWLAESLCHEQVADLLYDDHERVMPPGPEAQR